MAILFAAGLALPVGASAQDGPPRVPGRTIDRTGVDQIGETASGNVVSVQQVSQGARVVPPAQASVRSTEAAPQVARANDRTTAAPASGSSRADGKPAASAAIGGADRCDAQARGKPVAACINPIETRAGQYRAPNPTALSPEQRLAISQQAGDAATAAREAARLARAPDLQTLSATEQGVASIVLNTAPPTTSTPAESDPSIQVDPAVIDAIVQIVGGTPPPK